MAKETGAMAGELIRLEWTDLDFETKALSIRPEKGSAPRRFRMSNKLMGMINAIKKQEPLVFGHYKNLSIKRCYYRYRKRTALKFGNTRLIRITFHTFRHWKATMEYHKTKDLLHVMRILGHKNIKNTLLYTR